jgi:O-antigen/teichoic acid export membrane protein
MNREFLLNISFLVLINVIIKPLYILAIEVNVQNAVGPEEYGVYFALFNFCFLFQILNDFGIQNYNSRNIAQNIDQLEVNLGNILGIKLLLSFFFLGAIFLVALLFNYDKSVFFLLFLVALNQIILSFLLYLRTNIAASGKYRLDSVISVLDKLILIFILSYLLWLYPNKESFKIEWFVIAQMVALSITTLLAFVFNRKLVRSLSIRLSKYFSMGLIKKSYPYAVIIFLMIAYTKMDGIMLERMLDDEGYAAGVYAAGFRLLDASNMIGYLFAGLLLPMFASLLKNKAELQKLVFTGFSLIFVFSATLCIASISFRDEIMLFLYPEYATIEYGILLAYLMVTFVAMSMGYIFGTLLTANGDLKLLNIVFIIGIVINLSLNFYLIPKQQFIGAAIATLITQYVVLTGQLYIVNKLFYFKIKGSRVIIHIVFLLLTLLIFYILGTISELLWIYKIIIGIILAFIIALIFKLIDIRNFRETFSA